MRIPGFNRVEGQSSCCMESLLLGCRETPEYIVINVRLSSPEDSPYYQVDYSAVSLTNFARRKQGILNEIDSGIPPDKSMLMHDLKIDSIFLESYGLVSGCRPEIKLTAPNVLTTEEIDICLGKIHCKYRNFGIR